MLGGGLAVCVLVWGRACMGLLRLLRVLRLGVHGLLLLVLGVGVLVVDGRLRMRLACDVGGLGVLLHRD